MLFRLARDTSNGVSHHAGKRLVRLHERDEQVSSRTARDKSDVVQLGKGMEELEVKPVYSHLPRDMARRRRLILEDDLPPLKPPMTAMQRQESICHDKGKGNVKPRAAGLVSMKKGKKNGNLPRSLADS
ncbi:unnamed protein product [Linum trigynum]|uniref:Uncharacterized protein n=1 Tax=Linum trigynum TaxID=586398 RepID=A0AAV2GWV1_9ROSI